MALKFEKWRRQERWGPDNSTPTIPIDDNDKENWIITDIAPYEIYMAKWDIGTTRTRVYTRGAEGIFEFASIVAAVQYSNQIQTALQFQIDNLVLELADEAATRAFYDAQLQAQIDLLAGGKSFKRVTFNPAPDGVETVFTLDNPITDELVLADGQPWRPAADYVYDGNVTVTMNEAPVSLDIFGNQ